MGKKNPKNWKKVKSCSNCQEIYRLHCYNCRRELLLNEDIICRYVENYDDYDRYEHYCSDKCFIDYNISRGKIIWKEVRK